MENINNIVETKEKNFDPNRLKAFVKHDKDKLRPRLWPIGAYKDVLEVLEYGAKKYEIDNWKKCDDILRYFDAALRHLFAWREGDKIDPESGLEHLAHATCNLVFLMELDNED